MRGGAAKIMIAFGLSFFAEAGLDQPTSRQITLDISKTDIEHGITTSNGTGSECPPMLRGDRVYQ